MKKVLIGSAAARFRFGKEFREPRDRDYLIDGPGYTETITTNVPVKAEYFDCNRGKGLRKLFDESESILTPQNLYTLKFSHAFWSGVDWSKTMFDISFFQGKDLTLDEELFTMLYDDWTAIHGPKRAYLDKSNEEFFQDGVKRIFYHDDIHEVIRYYDEPMFKKLKEDKDSAMISQKLFSLLSHEDKIKTCREEIYVTALERFLIPRGLAHFSTLVAYRKACELLITSMTKGWFPKFIVQNWRELQKPDSHDFVNIFKKYSPSLRILK